VGRERRPAPWTSLRAGRWRPVKADRTGRPSSDSDTGRCSRGTFSTGPRQDVPRETFRPSPAFLPFVA
jgi:hypothetical protein